MKRGRGGELGENERRRRRRRIKRKEKQTHIPDIRTTWVFPICPLRAPGRKGHLDRPTNQATQANPPLVAVAIKSTGYQQHATPLKPYLSALLSNCATTHPRSSFASRSHLATVDLLCSKSVRTMYLLSQGSQAIPTFFSSPHFMFLTLLQLSSSCTQIRSLAAPDPLHVHDDLCGVGHQHRRRQYPPESALEISTLDSVPSFPCKRRPGASIRCRPLLILLYPPTF